jgi:hypothetical protein
MSTVYGKSELSELALNLGAIADWLRNKCDARHHEDMADVVDKATLVIEDLYDETAA